MSALLDAYNRRNKKINKIEKLKTEGIPLDFYNNFETICNSGYENLTTAQSKHFLKCFGIYDKGTNDEFAIRIRIPYGQLTLKQAHKFIDLANTYGRGRIDLTTRSQIELRHLKFQELPAVLDGLLSVGINTYQTAGDNIRGVITSPFDSYSKTSLITCESLVDDIQNVFVKNENYIGTLPRKFNVGVLGDTVNDCNIYGQDCCFVLAKKNEELGFNLYLGGKVGVQARPTNIFVKKEQVAKVFESLMDIFIEFGFRDNRNKNRLNYFIEEVGLDELENALNEKLNNELSSVGTTLVKENYIIDETSTVSLKDDKTAIYFPVPAGLFNSQDLEGVSKLMEEFDGIIRLTPEQSFFLIVNEDHEDAIKQSRIFKKYDAFNNVFFKNQIACAGLNECSFGVIPNKSDSIEMALYLNENTSVKNGKIRMYWSACPKGCGVHGVADIGFEGAKAKDENGEACYGVKIFLGGKATTEVLEARQLTKAITLPKAQEVVRDLINMYENEKIDNETFEEYDSRILSMQSVENLQAKIGL
jgi:ferredoxin-nitrite reductase